jgi:hypothetical protein
MPQAEFTWAMMVILLIIENKQNFTYRPTLLGQEA